MQPGACCGCAATSLIRLAQDSKNFKLHELVGCQIGTTPKVRLLALCVVFRELHFVFKGKLQVFLCFFLKCYDFFLLIQVAVG